MRVVELSGQLSGAVSDARFSWCGGGSIGQGNEGFGRLTGWLLDS